MKSLLILTYVFFASPVYATQINLKEFDQEKLAEVLGRIPDDQKAETRQGKKVTTIFPIHPVAYVITCDRFFYNGSPVPTDSKCKVDLEPNSNFYKFKHDQIKIEEEDEDIANAIFSALPVAGSRKKYYSSYYDGGVTFEGKKTNLFHFIFDCEARACTIYFSKKIESKD